MADHDWPIGAADEDRQWFVEQALRALDGLLEPGEREAFHRELAGDAAKRGLFVQLCLQHQSLSEIHALGSRGAEPGKGDLFALETASSPSRGTTNRARRVRRVAAMSVGLLVVAVVVAAWTAISTRRSLGPAEKPRQKALARGAYPRVGLSQGLAILVKLEGIEWDGPRPAEGDVLGAGHLVMRSGRATIAMLSGVIVTVEGPADLELVSADKILCHAGRLRARVPEGAEGFLVTGPGSAVVDLGTEFGMNVKAEGRTRGKVFQGKVEAAVVDERGALLHSQVMDRANEAFEINPRAGQIDANVGSETFVSAAEHRAPELVLDGAYADAVRGARPWGYWRFESVADGLTPNEIGARPPLRVRGPIQTTAGPGNRSLVFGPGYDEQHLVLDDLWMPPRSPGFAVELWFLPETISHACLVAMVAPRDSQFHNVLLELTRLDKANQLLPPASVRFLHRWPATDRSSHGHNLFSINPYIPYRWHHVVAQMVGTRMELFMDGKMVAAVPVDPTFRGDPCQVVVGRMTTVPKVLRTKRFFVGRIDELALYDHPLTPAEVLRHHQLASRPAGPREDAE